MVLLLEFFDLGEAELFQLGGKGFGAVLAVFEWGQRNKVALPGIELLQRCRRQLFCGRFDSGISSGRFRRCGRLGFRSGFSLGRLGLGSRLFRLFLLFLSSRFLSIFSLGCGLFLFRWSLRWCSLLGRLLFLFLTLGRLLLLMEPETQGDCEQHKQDQDL